ncbi:MAG: hypothetical protein LBT42_09035 [Tannerella sp.]|jgi:hypothetical protein|nr:hypothetical protein [Tannerella sp.]
MKRLYFYFFYIAVLLTFSLQTVAQGRDHNHSGEEPKPFDREAFFAKRNVYITEKAGLTAEEAAVFIPLENELLSKKFEVGRECHRLDRELRKKKEKKEKCDEQEYNKLLKCLEEVKEKRDKLDREYLEKFKKVLSAEQIIKYQAADREFFYDFSRDRK